MNRFISIIERILLTIKSQDMESFIKTGLKTNKDLIVTLIQADLKHNQLISGLRSLDLHTDGYFLELHSVVSQLMGASEKNLEQWYKVYDRFLDDAHKHPISDSSESLLPVAQECYDLLCASIKIENHFNPKSKH